MEQAARAFHTLADAEGDAVPMYARLCRTIADEPDASALLLEAPEGQRLPVLVLAALHDAVLREPDTALGAWYPTVGGDAGASGDLAAALRDTLHELGPLLRTTVRTRRVQTNEVNRSVAWVAALASTSVRGDQRPVALVELGASAGLNLWPDRAEVAFEGAAVDGGEVRTGRQGASPSLSTTVRTGAWPDLGRALPDVVHRVGIDSHPVDPEDPDQARWLLACVWPEQTVRVQRLRAALDAATTRPNVLRRGDVVDDLPAVLEQVPDDHRVVVVSSWVLAYLERSRRTDLLDTMSAAATELRRRGASLELLTLEADHVLPWAPAPPLPDDAPAELRHASLLVRSTFGPEGVHATALARCQAHLAWMDRLAT